MKISIAIATYNGEAYLQQQLDSFLNQTRRPDEVVVSDDNSTDNTVDILNSFKLMAPFDVKLIENKENVGYKNNFERALQQVSGELIFMSDQDDVWFENKIDHIVNLVSQHPDTQVFIHDTEITDGDLNPSGRTKMGQIRAMGEDMRGMVMGTCSVVRKSFIDLCVPMPDEILGHDDWIHLIAQKLETRKVIDTSLQYYRIHGTNTSDNIANTPKKISLVNHVFKSISDKKKLKDKLNRRLKYNILFKDWFIKTCSKSWAKTDYQEMIDKVDFEITSLKNRIKVYNLNRGIRPFFCLKMLINGEYASSSGFKSFFKDLIIS